MIKWGGTLYRLHPLFVLLMLTSVLTGYFIEMATLFGVVTIHELGHVAAAKSFGWRVRRVQLLPFGGVAEVEEGANVPAREECLVALCGPLQNLWMALFAYGMSKLGWGDQSYWSYFLQANMMVGLFNLLPVLPLDGGKILLSLLSLQFSYYRVLTASLYISILISLMMILYALLPYPREGIQLNVLIIGLFLFYSNWYSLRHLPFQFVRFLLSRESGASRLLGSGAVPVPLIVRSDEKPMEVFRRFKRDKLHLLYMVSRAGDVLRVVQERELIRAYLSSIGPPIPPGKVFRRGRYFVPKTPKIG